MSVKSRVRLVLLTGSAAAIVLVGGYVAAGHDSDATAQAASPSQRVAATGVGAQAHAASVSAGARATAAGTAATKDTTTTTTPTSVTTGTVATTITLTAVKSTLPATQTAAALHVTLKAGSKVLAGQSVTLLEKVAGTAGWTPVTGTTTKTGTVAFAASVTGTSAQFKAVYSGKGTYKQSLSATVTVTRK